LYPQSSNRFLKNRYLLRNPLMISWAAPRLSAHYMSAWLESSTVLLITRSISLGTLHCSRRPTNSFSRSLFTQHVFVFGRWLNIEAVWTSAAECIRINPGAVLVREYSESSTVAIIFNYTGRSPLSELIVVATKKWNRAYRISYDISCWMTKVLCRPCVSSESSNKSPVHNHNIHFYYYFFSLFNKFKDIALGYFY
jgi:hypothetical protein